MKNGRNPAKAVRRMNLYCDATKHAINHHMMMSYQATALTRLEMAIFDVMSKPPTSLGRSITKPRGGHS